MKDKNTISDPQLEQWLKQALPGEKAPSSLYDKLQGIPEQFPRAVNVTERELADQFAYQSSYENRWLYPLLATAASVVGILFGTMDLLAVLPEEDLLTALLYGTPDLNGIAL